MSANFDSEIERNFCGSTPEQVERPALPAIPWDMSSCDRFLYQELCDIIPEQREPIQRFAKRYADIAFQAIQDKDAVLQRAVSVEAELLSALSRIGELEKRECDYMREFDERAIRNQKERDAALERAEKAEVERDQLQAERSVLRGALIYIGRKIGCLLSDEVSTGFIATGVPDELNLKLAKYESAIAALTSDRNGDCPNKVREGEKNG